jgi:Autophagy protein Apg5
MGETQPTSLVVSASATQTLNWDGRILIHLTLAPTSVSSPTIPPPIHVLVPRNTYLHVGLQSAVKRFYPFAPISPTFAIRGSVLQVSEPDPGVHSDEEDDQNVSSQLESTISTSNDASNSNQKYVKFVYPICWFEDEETKMAIRWQYFVGLLFDMTPSCSIPWKIKLHFNNYPTSQILPLEYPNILTNVQACYKHSLKQSMTVATGTSKSAMNITKESHGLLWDAVSSGNFALYQRVDLISTQKQPLQAIPIRVLVNATNPPIQRRIDGTRSSIALGQLLHEWLPEHFLVMEQSVTAADIPETTTIVQANHDTIRCWRICGIQPPLSTNILDLWRYCAQPDLFLYIVVLTR